MDASIIEKMSIFHPCHIITFFILCLNRPEIHEVSGQQTLYIFKLENLSPYVWHAF